MGALMNWRTIVTEGGSPRMPRFGVQVDCSAIVSGRASLVSSSFLGTGASEAKGSRAIKGKRERQSIYLLGARLDEQCDARPPCRPSFSMPLLAWERLFIRHSLQPHPAALLPASNCTTVETHTDAPCPPLGSIDGGPTSQPPARLFQ